MPLYQVMEESYAVYFNAGPPPSEIPYAAGGATVPSADISDWDLQGASSTTSKLPGAMDLRTSGPGTDAMMTLVHPIAGKGHKIDQVSLTFRYLAGYDSGEGAWPVLTLDLVSAETSKVVKTLYTSPPLDKYKFDARDEYSPPIHASSGTGLGIDNDEALFVRVTVKDNARNVQIPLDPHNGLSVSVQWEAPRVLHDYLMRHSHSQFGTGVEL